MTNFVNIETEESRLESIAWHRNCHAALENALGKCHAADAHPLTVLSDDCIMNIHYLEKSHNWNFNFEGGGWNSIFAKSKEEAIAKAIAEYNEDPIDQRYHSKENGGAAIPLTRVSVKSFRLATEKDTAALMNSFY